MARDGVQQQRRRLRWVLVRVLAGVALLTASIWVLPRLWDFDRWLLGPGDFDATRLAVSARGASALASSDRSRLRAFYSGHSLSDGVPNEVARIATSRGQTFDFDVLSLPGSLIRDRVGEGLAILDRAGSPHDVLVVTERHDLPYAAGREHTARHLRVLHDKLLERNPQAETFLYHVWLSVDVSEPEQFVHYERQALVLWECVAGAVNRSLAGAGRTSRVRVLPGASALADLIERLARGDVEGVTGATPAERVQLLFSDKVHLSPAGRYFMGAVHYATLFGKSPEGSALPPEVSPRLGLELQGQAWRHAAAYALRARAAVGRDMALCRDFASQVICPLFASHHHGEPRSTLSRWQAMRRWRVKRDCERDFGDVGNADNPFR